MRLSLLPIIFFVGCYEPSTISAGIDAPELSEFNEDLAACDSHAVGSCLLISETFRSVDCHDEPEPADSSNRLWCDWSGCRSTLSWPLYENTISEDCYETACPSVWHARAAFQKCETDLSDDEFESDYVGCMRTNGCGDPGACALEQTEASLAAFKIETFECALDLYQRIRD